MNTYHDGQIIEYTSFDRSGYSVGQVVVSYAGEAAPDRLVIIRAKSGGKPFAVRESQLREHREHSATGVCTLAPDRPHADVGVCTACVEQGLFRSAVLAAAGLTDDLDDGGDDVTDALAAPELLDDSREHCPSCGAELAGWHDDRSALCEPCQDELIPWKMTPRTREVILAALEVAARLPAQRAECQRVAEIVREAGQTGGE